ncbi:hypothetical protein HIM_03877 [Hirsutella minnesotensis 3608]|uniref:Uncharacterized protein n=1 Tax=Hirsutella minnesotensis 3608 TaxID=1043627 RepID=A0A0F7ZLM2_9HYPO|nr:hypothetical protein HIM_03877 [Hirsutella minnesotensis 3608]
MPRFSVAFSKRKSAADDFSQSLQSPEQSSFRVIERHDVANGKSFDGGARLTRASGNLTPKPHLTELHAEENMFADLKANRGSGVSNTTNATSTDNSSRHSNASTAPSSADLSGGVAHDEPRPLTSTAPHDSPTRGGSKSSFLDRATRTFSFGGQKKHSIPPPKDQPRVPDLPPILRLQGGDAENRARGMTASTASTATPQGQEESDMDLGGDFGSMFTSFGKRASMATLKNGELTESRSVPAIRQLQPSQMSPDFVAPAEPLLGPGSPRSPIKGDTSPIPYEDTPPPVPRHQSLSSPTYADRAAELVEDEDAKLLQESFTAMKLLSEPEVNAGRPLTHRYRRDEDTFTTLSPKQIGRNHAQEDNIFDGSMPRLPRTAPRNATTSPTSSQQNKVMTPAEFEKYREHKARQDSTDKATQQEVKDDDDDDEINYDDEDDEQEKSRQQAKQRRKQEAHMTIYRQQMMKVTGESASPPVARSGRVGLLPSPSAPQLTTMKTPSPDLAAGADEDEDEDVPLGILQAHGFPGKNRPPTRLSHAGSISNLRASTLGMPSGRPASVNGDAPVNAPKRPTTLPAFARNLPQDPFIGASLARPALRESLSFGDAGQLSHQQGPLPPGGLVGVIASEERQRAMRRGSPSFDHKLPPSLGMNGPHFDHAAGLAPQMMYGGMPGMHAVPQPQQMLTPGDQAQIQMTQQMHQFMQMQMQFMQMMATNQGGGGHPMQPQMQPPYGAGLPGSLSMADLSSRHSMMGEPMAEPPRMEHMRSMSMVQPSSASFVQLPQLSLPSNRGSFAGYAPSIAPSERSNVGLPGRYRPVSQAPPSPALGRAQRASTMSGSLANWNDDKNKSTVKIVDKAGEGSDEDDEQGWAAMKAKREKKRSIWKSRKSFGSELAL